jgi:hypothetical protein
MLQSVNIFSFRGLHLSSSFQITVYFPQITKTKGKPKQTNSHREGTIFCSAEALFAELQPRSDFYGQVINDWKSGAFDRNAG